MTNGQRGGLVMKNKEKLFVERKELIFKVDDNNIFIDSSGSHTTKDLLDNLKQYSNIRLTVVGIESFSKNEPLVKLKEVFDYLEEANIKLHVINQGVTPRISNRSYYQVMASAITREYETQKKLAIQQLNMGRKKHGVSGRPQIHQKVIINIQKLYQQKKSFREIADICDVSLGTAYKYSKIVNKKE